MLKKKLYGIIVATLYAEIVIMCFSFIVYYSIYSAEKLVTH